MGAERARILHIDTERTWRGGEQQAFSLIQGLRDRGYKNFAAARRAGEFSQKLKAAGLDVLDIAPLGEWDFLAAHRVNRYLKKERIQIVHAHSGHAVALAGLAVGGTKTPIVVTRRVDFHLGRNIFSKWKYRRPDRIIAISTKVRDVLILDGIPPQKIDLVFSGIDFRRFQSVKKIDRRELDVSAEHILIGQVAALAPHKDQMTFLRAIRRLSDDNSRVRALIVGEGECRQEIEKEIKRLGLERIIRLVGFKENPLDYLASFDFFCLSSKDEGLGTSILDAMALQIPVVATRAGGIPDLIEDGVTGYLAPPQDPDRLADGLKRAISSPNNKELILRAAQKAKEFDIIKTIEKTEAVYQQLLKIPPLAVQRGG